MLLQHNTLYTPQSRKLTAPVKSFAESQDRRSDEALLHVPSNSVEVSLTSRHPSRCNGLAITIVTKVDHYVPRPEGLTTASQGGTPDTRDSQQFYLHRNTTNTVKSIRQHYISDAVASLSMDSLIHGPSHASTSRRRSCLPLRANSKGGGLQTPNGHHRFPRLAGSTWGVCFVATPTRGVVGAKVKRMTFRR